VDNSSLYDGQIITGYANNI